MNALAGKIGFAALLALGFGFARPTDAVAADAPKPEAAAPPAAEGDAKAPAADAKETKDARESRRMRELVEDLGSDEYGVRRRAGEALRDAGAKAEPALKAALNSDDPEVRWQARQILRDLETERVAEAKRAEREARKPPVPRDRAEGPGEAPREAPAPMPPDAREWFREMDDIMRQMDALRSRRPLFDLPFPEDGPLFEMPLPGGGPGAAEGPRKVEIEIWDNGQHAKYSEAEDGSVKAEIEEEGKVKKFESKSRAEFLKDHPELAKRFGVDASGRAGALRDPFGPWGFALRVPGPGAGLRDRTIRRPRTDRRAGARGEAPEAPEAPRLGVGAEAVPEALRMHLKIPEGEGLLVREVFPGTPAERMGIERLDILLKVAGKPVASPEDVTKALEGAKAGEDVEAEVLRGGERKALKGKR